MTHTWRSGIIVTQTIAAHDCVDVATKCAKNILNLRRLLLLIGKLIEICDKIGRNITIVNKTYPLLASAN